MAHRASLFFFHSIEIVLDDEERLIFKIVLFYCTT